LNKALTITTSRDVQVIKKDAKNGWTREAKGKLEKHSILEVKRGKYFKFNAENKSSKMNSGEGMWVW
jgi:hypothetical protein